MPSAANIVIADAQGTPVDHTFVPVGFDKNGVFWWDDQTVGGTNPPAIGFWRISAEFKRPASAKVGDNSSNRVQRITIGLHEPVLETVSNSTVTGIAPAPTVAYIQRAFMEYIIPERASYLDRANLAKMSSLLILKDQIVAMIRDGQFVY